MPERRLNQRHSEIRKTAYCHTSVKEDPGLREACALDAHTLTAGPALPLPLRNGSGHVS